MIRTKAFFFIFAVIMMLTVSTCGNKTGNKVEKSEPEVNAAYYDYLKNSAKVNHPDAQPQAPGSGEFYSEDTKHFDLEEANSVAVKASLLLDPDLNDFVVYKPAGLKTRAVRSASTEPAIDDEIPGFKNDNNIAEECLGKTGEDLTICMDESRRREHISYHDAASLTVQLGENAADRAAELVMNSLNEHLGTDDKIKIIESLTGFANDSPVHSSLDLSNHNIFNKSGYSFSHAIITDAGQGDTDGDGELESHSTLVIEIRKTLKYDRGSSEIDACVSKYAANKINDEYVFKINAFVHLDHLEDFRKNLDVDEIDMNNPTEVTLKNMLEQYADQHDQKAINQALDANILRHILSNTTTLPWSATEFMLHFQVTPANAAYYGSIVAAAMDGGDERCYDVVNSHINPHTAIISGREYEVYSSKAAAAPKIKVFYQVPVWNSASNKAAFSAAGFSGSADFCLKNEDGRNIAIMNPSTGEIVPACERLSMRKKITRVSKASLTTEGACNDNKDHWAYWPSRVRTPRIGSFQLILTEFVLNDQVADYWSIKWYQNGWKAVGQVVMKGGMFVVGTYLKIQTGQLPGLVADADVAMLTQIGAYFVNAVLPTLFDSVFRASEGGGGIKIAGYVFMVPKSIMNFALGLAKATVGNPTFLEKMCGMFKGFLIGFAIDRATSTVGQIADATFFGWQDFSKGSDPGCFQFQE